MRKILGNVAVREFLRVLLAVSIALLLGFIVTLLVSEDPLGAYKSFLLGPISKFNRFGDWIEESITLILVGLAIAIAFEAKQFSLGAEGQLILGALVAGSVILFVPVQSVVLRITLAVVAAAAIGFLWGLIPGYLKAYLDANELVSTLMLNSIALKMYDYFLTYWIKPEGAGYTASDFLPKAYQMPSFMPKFAGNLYDMFSRQTNITVFLYIMIAAFIGAWFLIYRTPFGYELRMVGSNIKFAAYGGINTKKVIVLAFAISGIFAGLAGAHLAQGIHNKLILNISLGLGFEGIVVATMARNNPLFIPLSGLAYGYMRAGADIMERATDMSREMVMVVQAMIILLVTAEGILPVIQQRVNLKGEENGETAAVVEGGSNGVR
jgi:general nucleoside transport system permease protein